VFSVEVSRVKRMSRLLEFSIDNYDTARCNISKVNCSRMRYIK